ncbi:hypothetical protein BHE74_00020414 [Ensete ventricosum]|nr:hypothetical protein BHE74_00020414 [Ensete ventricosum]
MIGVMKLQSDDVPRSSLGIGPGSNDTVGPHWEFATRFTKVIGKLAGNTPRDRRKKVRKLTTRMPEAAGLMGAGRLNYPYPRFYVLSAVDLPRPAVELLVPGFYRYV